MPSENSKESLPFENRKKIGFLENSKEFVLENSKESLPVENSKEFVHLENNKNVRLLTVSIAIEVCYVCLVHRSQLG
jgi:hypothetical protein